MKRIVLINLQDPYGKKRVYMSGSVCVTAARLMAMDHAVNVLDFNIESPDSERVQGLLGTADLIGVSLLGCPDIPNAIDFARRMTKQFDKPILFGGQVIRKLTRSQFARLFHGTNAVHMQEDDDLAAALGRNKLFLPLEFGVALAPVWKKMPREYLEEYLRQEFTLVVSQGCKHQCGFCAAQKKMREQHVQQGIFKSDLQYLVCKAEELKITTLKCYASSLDFFQNPLVIAQYLEVLAKVQQESGVRFKLRALSCMDSFLDASAQIPDFADLLRRAGLFCVGFGVDGTDDKVWQAQKKGFNHLSDVPRCLDICTQVGIRPEVLMVLGFPQDTAYTLWKNFINAMKFAMTWPSVAIRPYLGKTFIPGNEGWDSEAWQVQQIIEVPRLFYNLDYCALGSKLTHPRILHRWMCNATYIAIIALLTPMKHCVASPLLAQGSAGLMGRIAQFFNRFMPSDR